jgi:long-chain acyl-CoA synthetase
MGRNLATNIIDAAQRYGDRPAIKLDDFVLNWEQLENASARAAALLAEEGMKPGDRVGLMLPNVPQFPILYYGILRAGGIVVPMNVLLKEREVAYYLEDSGAKLLLAWEGMFDAAENGAGKAGAKALKVDFEGFVQRLMGTDPREEIADREGSDTAVLLYTSGTTGSPKGAELTHDNLRSNAETSAGLYDGGPEDVMLGALSLIPRFDPEKAL